MHNFEPPNCCVLLTDAQGLIVSWDTVMT